MNSPILDDTALRRLRDEFVASRPDAGSLDVAIFLATATTIEVLGVEWARANKILGGSPGNSFIPAVEDSSEDSAVYKWQHRLFDLGILLYECQTFPGFRDNLSDFRKHGLRGVVAELRIARFLSNNGHSPRFQKRSGVKGDDFDIEATIDGQVVPIEVKAKEDDTEPTRATLSRTFGYARTQFPLTGPGLVFLALPDSWMTEEAAPVVMDSVKRALRNYRHWNAIILTWEEEFVPVDNNASGRGFAQKFRIIESEEPKVAVSGIGKLLAKLTPDTLVPARLPSLLAAIAPEVEQ